MKEYKYKCNYVFHFLPQLTASGKNENNGAHRAKCGQD